MKICFLSEGYHRYRGGIESFTHSIAHNLIKAGHEVHILVVSGDEKYYLEDKQLRGKGLYIHTIELSEQPFPGFWKIDKIFPLYEIYFSQCIIKKLDEIIAKFHIDVLESSVINFWYFKKRIPFIIRLHGYAGFENRYCHDRSFLKLIRQSIKWLIEKIILEKANTLISVSFDHALIARDIWKLKRKIVVIHNGIDTVKFHSIQAPARKGQNILFVGRIKAEKGVGVLADAIPEVLSEFPHTKFIFIGKDSQHDETKLSYIEFLKKKIKNQNAVFLGTLSSEEVITHYQKNAICAFPSIFREPFPMVTLEAMACGCAVIASKKRRLH